MLRIALAGTGRAAKARARDLALSDDARLALVVSHDLDRARLLAQAHGADAGTDWLSALARPDIDAVMISTRNERHVDLCRAALDARKHVCVDYPFALSLREGEQLLALARKTGCALHVEHIDLLSPWFQAFRSALPRIGELRGLLWNDIGARQPTPQDWTFDTRSGFSLFAGASVLSRLICLAGPALAAAGTEQLDGLCADGRFQRRTTTAQLRFAHGVTGLVCDGTGFATPGPQSQLVAIGTHGILTAEARKRVELRQGDRTEIIPLPSTPGLFAQDIAAFCALILRNEPPYVSLEHVRAVLRAADMIERSVKSPEAETV